MHLLPTFALRRDDDDISHLLNTIQHCDAMELLRRLPDASVDLIVTSPPFNLRNSTGNGMQSSWGSKKWKSVLGNGYDNYSDDMPYDDYIAWQRDCLSEMMRVIPEHGAIFYNHKRRVQGGLIQDPIEIVNGFPLRQIIIRQLAGGINANSGYFLPTYELIYMIAKPDFKLNKDFIFIGDVWYIPQENDNPHPAPFPVELPYRIIASSYAKTVCDPFMGSGSTAVAAKNLGVDFIGSDLSSMYVELARKRLQDTDPFSDTVYEDGTKQLSLWGAGA